MVLTMDNHPMELDGKYLGLLRESNDLLQAQDLETLRSRLKEDGYLLIRRLHEPQKVEATRRYILEQLDANEQLDRSYPIMAGTVAEGARGAFMGGQKQITHSQAFLDLVESPEIMGFFEGFLGAPVLTYNYKWLRVVGPKGFTGAHYDIVYMGRGTTNVYTCWTPLGDIPLEMGPLAVLVGSHRFEKVKETYGQMDVDRDHVTGWFSRNPIELVDHYGGQWQTSSFQMGDAVIFGMFTMHGSLDNTTRFFRLSCDTRYQRADEPVDERWVGENPKAHYAWTKGQTIPMEEMRKKWKV